jgi:adenine phosphoribosyltransferase
MTGTFVVNVRSITTDKVQTLYLDTADAELMKGKRILIVDDVISTGESLFALEELVRQAGGIIAGKMAVLAEGDAIGREDISYIHPLPLFNKDGSVKG